MRRMEIGEGREEGRKEGEGGKEEKGEKERVEGEKSVVVHAYMYKP